MVPPARSLAPFVLSLLSLGSARAEAPLGSVGFYSHGSLDGGVPLPDEGPDHYALFPARCYELPGFALEYADSSLRENTWGNPHAVAALLEVAAAVRGAHPDAPRIAIAEIANRRGGEIPQHLSHQNGLDADVVFLQRGDGAQYPVAQCTPYGQLRRFEQQDGTGAWGVAPDFELAWNWALASTFAARRDVRVIFVGRLLKEALGDWARQARIPAAERRRTLGKLYPVRCRAPRGVTLPFYGNNACPHDDHFHVRFACPKDSPRCLAR